MKAAIAALLAIASVTPAFGDEYLAWELQNLTIAALNCASVLRFPGNVDRSCANLFPTRWNASVGLTLQYIQTVKPPCAVGMSLISTAKSRVAAEWQIASDAYTKARVNTSELQKSYATVIQQLDSIANCSGSGGTTTPTTTSGGAPTIVTFSPRPQASPRGDYPHNYGLRGEQNYN